MTEDDKAKPPSFSERLVAWFRMRRWLVGVLGLISGIAVGMGIPVWQTYWIEQPELSIEINGISRTISPEAAFPADDEVLAVLFRRDRGSRRPYRLIEEGIYGEIVVRRSASKKLDGLDPEIVQVRLEGAKQELKDLPDRIEARKQELNKIDVLTPESIAPSDVARLNRPMRDEVDVAPEMFDPKSGNRNTVFFKNIRG